MPRVSREQAQLNREKVVEVASALFRERGLNGIGVADIMAAAGLTVGGFYGQFASKDALAGEAFAQALEGDTRDTFDAFIETYLSQAHIVTPGRGCPVAALANDAAREAPDSPIRVSFTSGVRRFVDRIVTWMPEASRGRRRERAMVTLATLVGAVTLARAVNDDGLRTELLDAIRAGVSTRR